MLASLLLLGLALAAEPKEGNRAQRVVSLVKARPGLSGIVYAATRNATEDLAEIGRSARIAEHVAGTGAVGAGEAPGGRRRQEGVIG